MGGGRAGQIRTGNQKQKGLAYLQGWLTPGRYWMTGGGQTCGREIVVGADLT
jgi:hypothetical protein